MTRKFPFLNQVAFWMALAFLGWIYAFWGFLSGHLALEEDALSYYDHIKFYVESLSRGVFPLWDPFWYSGASNDFFLRRIGAYNPFYLIILIFKSLGLSYTLSYLWFLATYYFLGMTGFYLLLARLYTDRRIAFMGFLMLLFSALGTRLFDSYMMLITVPLIWLFFFLVAFVQTPRKHYFLGMTLAFVILATTYIPFYFLMFIVIMVPCFVLIYPKEIKPILERCVIFIKAHRVMVAVCVLVAALSFVPMLLFYHQSSESIALPGRHGVDAQSHVLTVPVQTLKWGVLEDLLYSSYFSNIHRYKFAIVYVPFFAVISLSLGLFCRLNRRLILLFASAFILFVSIIPHGLPFYDFLNKHVFFMKYFRNLHFFLWFVLIPLFVMIATESLRLFLELKKDTVGDRWRLSVGAFCVHALAFAFIWWRQDIAVSTCIMLILSSVLMGIWIWGGFKNGAAFFALVCAMIMVQPLECYWYLSQKSAMYVPGNYSYDAINWQFKLREETGDIDPTADLATKSSLYYASKTYNELYNNVSDYALSLYLRHKILLMDSARLAGIDDWKKIEKEMIHQEGMLAVEEASALVKVVGFDANHLRLRAHLPTQKFLIYNDSYDPQWQAFVNGKPVAIAQVNGAFKGVWVPKGDALVEFRYGKPWQYTFNLFLMMCFYGLLIALIGCAWQGRREKACDQGDLSV